MRANRPTLIIRADADSRIGTGHVMRCIALGQAWQDAGGAVVFATCCDSKAILQRLHDESFIVERLNASDAFLEKLSAGVFAQYSGGWVVCDGYHFDAAYHGAIRAEGYYKLMVIDDYNHLSYYNCDILLNQNISAQSFEYKCGTDCLILRGLRYVMLRREFRKFDIMPKSVPSRAKKVLVTLGGGDPDNVTLKVVKGLNGLSMPDLSVKIIVGMTNPNRESIVNVTGSSSYDAEVLSGVPDMTGLFDWADVAISAGGSTCWELCYMGVPALVVVIADNQREIAEHLGKAGAVVNLGWHELLQSNDITHELSKLLASAERREYQTNIAMSLVDGKGAERVVAAIRGTL